MRNLMALVSGLAFGLGLILAGMANPVKVQGFLDLFGAWDPSLALVMGGAILVAVSAFTFAKRRQRTLLGEAMSLPKSTTIDRRLLAGSAAFGVGWGLVGLCPGPALVALGTGDAKAIGFVAAMLAGMGIFELLSLRDRGTLVAYARLARNTVRGEDA